MRGARISRRTFVAAGAVLPFAGGCGARADRVELWAMGREAQVVPSLLSGAQPRLQQLAWTTAHQKLLTAFAGESLPDIFQLGNTWVPELVALGALEPLDEYVAHSSVVKRDDYFAGIWDTNVVHGSLYGVPWYVDTRLFYYRRDLLAEAGFDAPPTTWDEWSRMLAAVKRLVGPHRYSVLLPLNEFEPLLALALQQHEPLLREEGRWGNFSNAAFRRTLRFYVEIFRRGWAPAVTNTEIANVWHEFGRGFFTFYISGPWNIREFKQRLPPSLQSAWMTAPLPGPHGPGDSTAGGSSLVIARRSRRKRDAWRLIEQLSRPETQASFHAFTGSPPPRRSVWDTSHLASDPYARAFRVQLERARAVPKVAEWERIMDEMRLVSERAVEGELTVEAATEFLDARVDRILAKRRYLLDRGALV